MRSLCTFALICSTTADWREQLVPSFEADYSPNGYEAPGAVSFQKVTEILHKFQADNGINEALLDTLPFLPVTTTLNVTMSDGVEIWTRVVNPHPHDKKKPACLVRSPYGSKATQNLALVFLVLNGHAAVMQETRGTWSSGGEFDMWRGSNQDAQDTMAWISSQGWSDGEVYSMGASADGIDSIEMVLEPPKNLRGQWLIWTTGNGHHFVYPGGAYRKDLMLGYFDGLAGPTRHASDRKVIPATEQNENFDSWWYNLTDCADSSNVSVAPGCRYKNVKWPMIMNAGWWDLFHQTMLDAWVGLRSHSDPSFRDDHVLIVGPLGHDIAGGHDFGNNTFARLAAAEADALVVGGELSSEFWKWSKCTNEWAINNDCKCQGRVRFGTGETWSEPKMVRGSIKCNTDNFFDPAPGKRKECECQEARGKKRDKIGRVNLFVMGNFGLEVPAGSGNYWTSLDEFPTPTKQPFYLGAGEALTTNIPNSTGASAFVYNPSDATPMLGGNNLPAVGHIKNCGSADQLSRENRSDVIVFDSAPLQDELRVVGGATATVFVSSNVTDTDFFVTVSDLHPDSKKSMLVRFGIQRMRWRESEVTKSEPMTADQVYEVTINLGYTAYIFPKGHSIRVSVSSAADPYFVPNTNTGENDMVTKVTPIVAKNAVHFAPGQPSRVNLPVVSAADIPENRKFNAVPPFLGAKQIVV